MIFWIYQQLDFKRSLLKKGFSNSDVNHEEDFENNSIVDVNTDTIDIEDTTIQTNSTTVPDYVNKFSFYDDP